MRGRAGPAIFTAIMLAGCGVQSQQTPEPHETDRIQALAEELGTQRSWDRKTGSPNPEPDGRVLLSWAERRKRTLDGTVRLTELPALQNPGKIEATLKWEREAQAREEQGSALNHYMLDFERRKIDCPTSARKELQWYEAEREAHAKGQRTTLIDWKATNARYSKQCDVEAGAISAEQESDRKVEQETDTKLMADEKTCREPREAAERDYIENPTAESGAAASAATRRMNECLDAIRKARQELRK